MKFSGLIKNYKFQNPFLIYHFILKAEELKKRYLLMTLDEAKIADRILNDINTTNKYKKIGMNPTFKKDYIDSKEGERYQFREDEYFYLFTADKLIVKKNRRPEGDFDFYLTDKGLACILFKGGYTKMIEEKIEKKRREKNKYRFDIGKDIVLILLAIGTLLISYFAS